MSILTTKYVSVQSEMEDFELYPPFAKRSKEVNRYSDENQETQMQILSPEESVRYESVLTSQLNIDIDLHSAQVGRPDAGSGGLIHEMLPRPSQLMGRRRRDHILQRHSSNVLQHIGDLRTRQRHINELKGDRWWGATVVESRVPQQVNDIRSEEHPGPIPHFLFTGCDQMSDLAPGGNPMMSFVEGTAHRPFAMTPACGTVDSGITAGVLQGDYDEMFY